MARGNKMLSDMKPRAPTTGLQPRTNEVSEAALSGRRNIPFSRAGAIPRRGSSARRLAAETITQGPSGPKPGASAIAPGTMVRRTGMVRDPRREPRRLQRTQFIGGMPSAVRVSFDRDRFYDLGQRQSMPTGAFSTNTYRPDVDYVGFPETQQLGDPLKRQNLMNLMRPLDSQIRERIAPTNLSASPERFMAKGGDVDTVPAWLQPGEFVIDKAHTQQIKKAKGGELEKAIDGIIEDIKLGRRPGDRPVEGRTDFTDGGTVTKDMEPGYQLGGNVEENEPARKTIKKGVRKKTVLERFANPDDSPVFTYKDAKGRNLTEKEAMAQQDIYDAEYEQEKREREQMRREQAASAQAREQQSRSLEAMRAASARRTDLAREQGAELQRKAGEVAAKEQRTATAQAARLALSRASIQPVEASLSTASQLQLRSALQGAIIRSQAELEAQRMSLAAEMQQVQDDINIASQEFGLAVNREDREFALSRQREAQNRQAYLAQQGALLNMKLQKAQQPGFWESLAPGLIQGAFTVAGAAFAGPMGGMIAGSIGGAFGNAAGQQLAQNRAQYMGLGTSPTGFGYGGTYKHSDYVTV